MTFHSQSAFDAALTGIPTIFIDMLEPLSPNEMFLKQFKYPCEDLVIKDTHDFKKNLINYDDKDIFRNHCEDVYDWSKEFYHDFNEQVFGKFLNKK